MKQSFQALLILTGILFYSLRMQDSSLIYNLGISSLFGNPVLNAGAEPSDEKTSETPVLYRTAEQPDNLLFDDPGTIRINCGGSSILFGTESWIADTYFTNGSGYSTSSAIANTTNDGVYQSERYGNHGYSIPVTNGSYTVKLHFAEIFFNASNSRLFNVTVEGGQASLSSYDVYLKAGGKNIAKIEQFNNITVSDGALNISLTNVKDNAKISGIEVIPTVPAGNTAPVVSSPISDKSVVQNTPSLSIPLSSVFSDNNGFANLTLTVSGNSNTSLVNSATITSGTLNLGFASGQTGTSVIKVRATDAQGLFIEDEFNVAVTSNVTPATLIRINCGGGNLTFGSETWISDAYYSNGSGYSNNSAIANTTNDALYQSERYGTHSYNVPVPAGTYTVKLHFAEIYFSSANQRLFNVNVEGGQANLSNYDIYIQAGGSFMPKVEQFNNINVSDGTLNISFTNIKDNAKISGIEVISSAPASNTAPTVASPVADQSVAFNTTSLSLNLANTFADNNGVGSLTLSVSGNSNTAIVSSANLSGSTLSMNLVAGQTGSSNIKIKATDAEGLFVEDQFSVTILPPAANTPPVVSSPIPDQNVAINSSNISIPLSAVFTDNNGFANLTLSVSGNTNTSLVNLATISGSSLSLGFAAGQTGTANITVKATDAEGLFIEDQFTVTIPPPAANTPPVVSSPIPDQTVAINSPNLSIPLGAVFTDNNGLANLTLTVSGNTNTSLVNLATISGSTLTLGFAAGQTGTANIKVKATDAQGLNIEDEFSVLVTNNTTPATQIRLNCGGPVQTYGSVVWSADNYYTNGSGYGQASAIANTTQDELYQTERYGNFSYNIPVPNGSYTVKLHFAEIYFTASNSRLFNLNVENGQVLLSNYDIFVQAGGNNIAKIEQYNNINVSDGQLTITCTSVKDNAKISAIEIISTVAGGANTAPLVASPIADQTVNFNTPSLSVNLANTFTDNNGAANISLSVTGNSNFAIVTQATLTGTTLNLTLGAGQTGSSTIKVKATDAEGLFVEDEFIVTINSAGTPSTHIRINAGGPAQTYGSETWIADAYFTNGTAYNDGGAIANTSFDELYQNERYGNHSYNIPVPNGAYTVKLHFAEVSHNSANARLFNVNIENGQAALTNYDLFVQAGGANIAKIEQFNNVSVSDGFITIAFTSLVNNAKISAIEVISSGVGGNQNPIAAAGSDATINLPNSVVSLSGAGSNDPDGNITNYTWSKFSGPSSYNITSPGSVNTNVTGLVAGTYVFRLTVTDNNQATGFDDVTIIVNDNSGGSPTTTFIALNGSWKYLDNGSNQGTSWKEVGYGDQSWATGNGEFGYGDGDEGTVVSYGGNSNNKYITTYFRKSITISNPASFGSFALGVKRDDGIVVYVNGSEVYRNNMPSGTISYNTLATTAASDDGATIQSITLPVSGFTNGVNVIAAEIHQSVQNSSDLSFDLRLIGNAGGSSPTAQILRGPYLQVGSSTAVTLRWRTDVPTDTKISVGTTVGSYPITTSNSTTTTEHEIRITGLNPDTKYFYSFGSSSQTLQSGADNYFRTAPPVNTTRKIGFAAFGDCGRNENGFQSGTLNAYQNFVGTNTADLLLLLGDNAYDFGTEEEYTSKFFNIYSGNILKNHITFPAPGNHDYDGVSQQSRTHAYYQAFSMPTNGESGGVPSGTKAYYSYNWGNVHFLSLDSYGSEGSSMLYDTTGPQVTWLKNDLAASTSAWTVVYFHHPPYSMGSHNSDQESDLIQIRQNLIRIFERFGVDMVIAGHSHDYERSYQIKNHFGNENSFDVNTHATTNSNGYYNGSNNSCAYISSTGHVNHGTVYIVAGSAGADGGVQNGYPHNAMPFSVDDGGMFYFEVQNNRLDAKFLRRDGVIADQFTIMKDVGKTTSVNINAGSSTTLTASWIGNYQWSNGSANRSITVSPGSSTTYSVTDEQGCITDNFNVNVNSGSRKMTVAGGTDLEETDEAGKEYKLYPVPVKKGQQLTITGGSGSKSQLQIINKEGRIVSDNVFGGRYVLETKTLSSGIYYVRIVSADKTVIKKFMIID